MEVEGLERHKQENPFNYTEDQLAEKKLALHNMKIIYPDVNPFYAEMVYDMCKNTDEAKIELLKQKVLSEPFKYKDRYKPDEEIVPEIGEFISKDTSFYDSRIAEIAALEEQGVDLVFSDGFICLNNDLNLREHTFQITQKIFKYNLTTFCSICQGLLWLSCRL